LEAFPRAGRPKTHGSRHRAQGKTTAVFPRDNWRKDGALPAVTPEKVLVPFVAI